MYMGCDGLLVRRKILHWCPKKKLTVDFAVLQVCSNYQIVKCPSQIMMAKNMCLLRLYVFCISQ